MDDKLHAAARTGDTRLFQQRSSQENDEISQEIVQNYKEKDEIGTYDDTYFCRQAEDGSNIIHIALRHGHEQFVKEALERYFDLIFQKDSIGDTPLHVAARLQTPAALRFLQSSLHNGRNRDSVQNSEIENLRILAVSNSKGNTILHEAARTNNYETIRHLLYWSRYTGNIEGIACTNHNNENFLHLLARYATYTATSSSYSTKYSLMARELYISASCAYVRDKDGFTPVLRAVQCRRLRLANFLVNKFPESIKIFDNKYRTVLHHLSAALVIDVVDDSEDITPLLKKFIEFHGVCDFRLAQDEDGNTPLHLAIMNEDVSTTKFLMELCLREEERPELTIINKDGHSIFNLLSSKGHIATLIDMAEKLNYALTYMEERQRVDKMMMDSELYQAAIDSDVRIFREVSTNSSQYFTRTSLDGSSIIHIAVRHAKPETIMFLQHALRLFPHLISKPDSNGDTLVHLAAKCKTDFSADIISMYYGSVKEMKGVATNPSAVKNYKGSLAIHEALQADNLKAAKILLERSEFVATTRINDLEETPLHAYARYGSSRNGDAKGFLSTLFKKDKSAAYIRDNQGFTPLLRAAMSARFHVVKAILDDCPQSANLRDPNGRTFLHLVRFTGGEVDESLTDKFEQTGKQLFKYPEVDLQRLVQDNDGNTPLHYAIKTGNSIVAIVLTQRCLESRTRAELDLVNKEGATVSDLLAAHDVPNEVIELIRKKEPEAVYSARSSYGIHKTDMKYSANALSVVAGLLTTITFAAGIQVPGGFNEDDGSSVLLLKPAFQAFIVFNTFAMCGSMLVLFYLLWVMGIGKIHGSLMVLDLSIFVLRACFYSTLGAFTTGVYVTTSEKSFWLAIFVCVICFLTIFVTIKVSVANITRLGKWVSKSSRMMLSLIRGRYNAHMTAIPFQPVANKDKVDVIVESKAP
ncbi:hypothetical protein BVRB_4g097260 [Beta vulgaris subsp. vulgaris]|uniref:PGG domain-containing protein n=1 Tax=Beta vulgaris subsp. vulgaris TaxID=3555 RepID=A0A0J8BDA3_BETVV|nr:hypothetical protein BVRB_4g097260 [Beta vulgaris subsp. vulgaris]